MATPDDDPETTAGKKDAPRQDERQDARQDGGQRAAVVAVAASAAVLTFAALVTFGMQTAFGVALGGALATMNLLVFVRVGRAFLEKKGTASWAMIAILKLLLLFGGVWMVLRTEVVSPLALAFGYGALPIGITLGGLFGPRPPDDSAT